jgi:hypothetical protein
MTKENCVRLLKHFEQVGRKDAYEDMKAHILSARKFSQEEKDALFPKTKEVKSKDKK